MDEVRGSPEDFFRMLPKFAYMMDLNNPSIYLIYKFINVINILLNFFILLIYIFFMFIGSITEYKVDVEGRFL